eukprot:TRINITY_DN37524_c0_g1_i2.p1 TRINITY_DN37524_c0_g1~~TRINITY_DN37524_c0_g1_i2.p1  ORF type:complete len:355 (+),score=109.60 TRINITY_DN37524_c0_g1_i2:353-1417(+)
MRYDLAMCFLGGPLPGHEEAAAAETDLRDDLRDEILPARIRLCMEKQWSEGLLQALQTAYHLKGRKPPACLLQKAHDTFCKLYGLPTKADLSVLFQQHPDEAPMSSPMSGVISLSMLACSVLEAQVSDHLLPLFQQLLNETYLQVRTRDRRDGGVPQKYKVVKVMRVYKGNAWQRYVNRRETIGRGEATEEEDLQPHEPRPLMTDEPAAKILSAMDLPPLEHGPAGEALLMHGTKPASAHGIAKEDFDMKFVRDGLFGRGIYFAESCSKSDEYTQQVDENGLRPLLLCRVGLGRILYCDERNPDRRRLERLCSRGEFDSVLGDRRKVNSTFREFIIYDPLQVYVHFLIWYTRLF